MPKSRLRLRWVCSTVSPWILAAGVLVSFTASAGQPPNPPLAAGPLKQGLAEDRASLVLARAPELLSATVRVASLDPIGPLPASRPAPAGPAWTLFEPREGARPKAPAAPAVRRESKGDTVAKLRPTLSLRTVLRMETLSPELRSLVAAPGDRVAALFVPAEILEAAPVTGGFVPQEAPLTNTRRSRADSSPAQASAGTPPARGGATPGTTPAAPRAQVLASTTPAPADGTPTEIAAVPVSLPPGFALPAPKPEPAIAKAPARKGYLDLIDRAKLEREQRCLAEAVYFEARSEPEAGQAAVAQVVLNRVGSGLYPNTVCGVVYQNRHRHLACQFTFACEGKSLRITDGDSWKTATRVAQAVLTGQTYLEKVGGATHYHANYVKPYWARRLTKKDTVGAHIFYQLKPGQT